LLQQRVLVDKKDDAFSKSISSYEITNANRIILRILRCKVISKYTFKMIRRFQFLAGLLVFVLTTSYAVCAAPINLIPITESLTTVVNKGVVGVWDYEVEGTEDAYRKGVLFVRMENGAPIVEVHLGNGVLTGQDVQLKGNTLKFIVNIEGTERVSVVLNAAADTIQGQASSSQGSFTIKGIRKLPPQ
jgi:hypothetical protein